MFLFILHFHLLIILVVLDLRISYSGLLADCGDNLSIKSHLELVKGQLVQRYRWYAKGATKTTKRAWALDQSVALWGSESAIRG